MGKDLDRTVDHSTKYQIKEKRNNNQVSVLFKLQKERNLNSLKNKANCSFRICQVESYHEMLLHFLCKRLNYLVNNDGFCLNSIFTFEKLWLHNRILPFSRPIPRTYKRQLICGVWWQSNWALNFMYFQSSDEERDIFKNHSEKGTHLQHGYPTVMTNSSVRCVLRHQWSLVS